MLRSVLIYDLECTVSFPIDRRVAASRDFDVEIPRSFISLVSIAGFL